MKKHILFLFLFVSVLGTAQTVNDYKYVIVPDKFDFFKESNKYDLNALSEFLFTKYGFQTVMANQGFPADLVNNRCNALLANVEEIKGFLITKLKVTLKDCNGKVLFDGVEGKSKEKDFKKAYTEALRNAFKSVEALHYTYSGKETGTSVSATPLTSAVKVDATVPLTKLVPAVKVNENYLFAQPINSGYQLVDTSPKVVLKIYKTTQPDQYIAVGDEYQGVLYKKENKWLLEYYKNDKLIVESVLIKF